MNKLQVKKVGVLSVAKIQAIVMAGISLIFAIPAGLILIVISLLGIGMSGSRGLAGGGLGIGMGIFYMIALPIIYGIIGFIAGAIGALLYNFFAKIVGGIEIEVDSIGGAGNMFRG